MKKSKFPLITIVFSILFCSFSFGQDWVWSGHASGTSGVENVTGIDLDENGNVFVTGTFGTGSTLDGTALSTQGAEDIFVAKYSPTGTLSWIRTGGSPDKDLSRTLVVDDYGEVYITGLFKQTATFDSLALNDKGSRNLVSDDNLRDVFIAKYNTNGQMLWVKRVAWGPNNDVPEGLSVDVNNNVLISGTFKESLYFSSDTLTVQKGNLNGYIAKFNSNGNFIWAKHTIHTHANTKFLNISAAVNDQIYLAGFLTDTMWVEDFTVTSRSVGEEDIILMKINEDGDVQWIRKAGSTGPDRGNSVYADPYGSVFITGYFTGTANFDSTGYNLYDSRNIVSKGGFDMFVAKYNNAGTLRWVGVNGSNGNDIGYGLYANDQITLASGYYSNTIYFGNDTLTSTGEEETGFFVFAKGGAPIFGSSAAGDGEDRGAGLVFDEARTQTSIMGYFKSTDLSLPPLAALTNASAGTGEGFIAAYDNPISVAIVNKSDPLCNGESTGYLKAETFFGAGNITYTWSHDPLLTGKNASDLPAGTYKLVVEDETGSKDSIIVDLIDPPAIVNTVEGTSVLDLACPEDNNGSIDITTSGGTGGYSYTWSGTGTGICVSCEDQVNLGPGDYYLAVQDDNACIKRDTITITRPDPITFGGSTVIDVGIKDPPPHDSGAVYLVTNGGTAPYSFSWTGPSGSGFSATTDTITGLIYGGNYDLAVTDDNSCAADTTFVVRSDTAFIAYICLHQNVICKGDENGILEVCMENGTGPYTYDWRNQFDNPAGTTKRVENLPPNTYTCTVTDQGTGKSAETSSVQIKQPINALNTSYSVIDPACFGYSDGSIDFTVTGGWGEYTYNWTPGNIPTEDLVDLPSGTYSCVVTDKEGCQAGTGNIDLTDPPLLVLDSIKITQQVVCFGQQNGEITAYPFGGTPPYKYQWDDANDQTSNPAIELAAREDPYSVVVTDFNRCTVEGSKVMTQPSKVKINSLTLVYPTTVGGSDASVTVHASGGTSPYQYRLAGGGFQPDTIFTGLSARTDTAVVVDNRGCGSSIKIFTIPEPIVFDNITITENLCAGDNAGEICVDASGGLGSLSYQWTGGPATQCYSNLVANSYEVTVTDQNNVSIDSTITLNDPATLTVSITNSGDPACAGGSNGFVVADASGGTGSKSYSWNSGETVDSIFGKTAGKYVVTAMDDNGCLEKDSITLADPPAFNLVDLDPTWDGSSGTISIIVSGGTPDYTYTLTGQTPVTIPETSHMFTDLAGGDYYITVDDANNCGPFQDSVIALSIGDLHFGSELKLYPNPSTGQFTIELENEKGEDLMIEIINLTGQMVYKKLHTYDGQPVFIRTIDLGEQAKGTYLMRINGLPVKSKLMIE